MKKRTRVSHVLATIDLLKSEVEYYIEDMETLSGQIIDELGELEFDKNDEAIINEEQAICSHAMHLHILCKAILISIEDYEYAEKLSRKCGVSLMQHQLSKGVELSDDTVNAMLDMMSDVKDDETLSPDEPLDKSN